jgi:adenosine deaminase
MEYDEYLAKMPKVELHCHLAGTVRAPTLVELAKKNRVSLPTTDPWRVYEFPIVDTFRMYSLATQCMVEQEDFARVAYESLEDAVAIGNLRYREMFFNPTNHLACGASYRPMVDGLIEGIEAAENDFGVRCRLIPSINREEGPQAALEMVREVLSYRRDEVIGIGMDGQEAFGPPENFAPAYAEAKKGGLHRTSHVCEDGPARNVEVCLDVLDCERLDHGYYVLEDPAVVSRVRDDGVAFCAKVYLICDWLRHPLKAMIDAGLTVNLNTDDPAVEHTNLAMAYVDTAMLLNYPSDKMRELCLNGVDAAWLDDEERRNLRREFVHDIDELGEQVAIGSPPQFVSYYRGRWWEGETADPLAEERGG